MMSAGVRAPDVIEGAQSDVSSPLLRMEGISKSFPGVRALKEVRLELERGEVHAVVGENGAGKSTLIKVLAGVHRPEEGTIMVDGEEASFRTPLDAQHAGISVIYQEFNLVPALTVRENVLLGRETARAGFISRKSERQRVRAVFDRMRVEIPLEARCQDLSVANQQLVEIAKALSTGTRILVMDEPTAALTDKEVEALFDVIRDLQQRGIGIIYISHRLDEVFHLADRVTVLRDGAHIATRRIADVTREQLIEMMVGRAIENEFPKQPAQLGEVLLEASGLTRGSSVRGATFSVRRGEVLGLTGLVGSGRTELARLLFGADIADAGTISLSGKPLKLRSPRDAIRAGISLLTEDRKAEGLILGLSARENFSLPNLESFSRRGFVARRQERSAFGRQIEALRIKLRDTEQKVIELSGGNQQKVLLARWLEANSEVVIFDEPTRGIDVGSKYEIYLLINRLAASGKAIIMISSELPEVLGMSDRILVMREGKISGEISDARSATQEQVIALAMHSADH